MGRRHATAFGVICLILVVVALAGLSPLKNLASASGAIPKAANDIGPDTSIPHRVEIDGVPDGNLVVDFDTLRMETKVIEYQDGTSTLIQKRPGQTVYYDFVLLCGVTGPCTQLIDWYDTVREQNVVQKTVDVFLLDLASNADTARWMFTNCWPSGLQSLGEVGNHPRFLWTITCELAEFSYL